MILIPQIYLKDGRTVALENTTIPIFDEDPYAMARAMMEAGSEALFIVDLNIAPVGQDPNFSVIKKIKNDLKYKVFIGGAFRAPQNLDQFAQIEIDMVVLDSHAYQQPQIVSEAIKRFPDRTAVHIDVRAGRVTIPGWTVAANKTDLDYAERFTEQGVSNFFYSNMNDGNRVERDNLDNLRTFCKKLQKPVYCTNEVTSLADIENLVTLGAPRLEGLILGRGWYQGRVDLRGANAYVADMILDSSNEPTLHDM